MSSKKGTGWEEYARLPISVKNSLFLELEPYIFLDAEGHDVVFDADAMMAMYRFAERTTPPQETPSPTEVPEEIMQWINEQVDKRSFQVPYDGSNKFYDERILKETKGIAIDLYHKMQEEIRDMHIVYKCISDSYNEQVPELIKVRNELTDLQASLASITVERDCAKQMATDFIFWVDANCVRQADTWRYKGDNYTIGALFDIFEKRRHSAEYPSTTNTDNPLADHDREIRRQTIDSPSLQPGKSFTMK
jgi:hypothetical protein